jgi:hypothetical protein
MSELNDILVKMNLARGLLRIWLVGTVSWLIYSAIHYYGDCVYHAITWRREPYPNIVCSRSFGFKREIYYLQENYVIDILVYVLGVPILAFVLGVAVLLASRWIAKGFRPSQEPQA